METPEVERRLVAILSADVAGYSRLMGDDHEATVQTLTAYREIFSEYIGRHHGRIVNAPGDAVLAEFASVVDAVGCAVELQRELAERNAELASHRRMDFRMGINLGDVLVKEEALYGNGVNIAARLEALAEPGGICISGTAYDQVKNRLPLEYDDQGEQSVKNIADPVRVYRVLSQPGAAAHRVVRAKRLAGRKGKLIGFAAAAAIVAGFIAVGVYYIQPPEEDPILAMPTGPTIAVLPFENMTGDPEQEYFSDGITEQIIAELTRFTDLHVLARNSTFQYKGKAVDVREIGTNLGADYIVEGSVRRGATRVRVTVQLLDASDGSHLWAETYDRELTGADLLDIQDEITRHVVATLADAWGVIHLARLQQVRGKANTDLNAYECQLRVIQFYSAITSELHLQARTCVEQSLETHPDDPGLLAFYANLILSEYRYGFNPRLDPLPRALETVNRAIALDRNNAIAHHVLALAQHARHDFEAFLAAAERAIALNPNQATTLVTMGIFMIMSGKLERGLALANKGIALNPGGAGWYHFAPQHYHYARGEYEQALAAALKINMPGFFLYHAAYAADFAQLGRMEEAQAEIEKLLNVYPDFGAHARAEWRKWSWNFEELIESYLDGLRKAGLEIPDEEEPK